MQKLGISIYLDKAEKEEIYTYMRKAAALGYTRIFTCFLSMPKESKDEYLRDFKEFIELAHQLGFEVSVDTNPSVFERLHASADNIKPFAELGIDILRLDDGSFGDLMNVLLTHNPYGIKIEGNASDDMGIEQLLKKGANRKNMMMCHNFYPERYTGLDFMYYNERNAYWKSLNLPVAAFVSSNEPNTIGPWKVSCGLPTVELIRGLPIDVQARYLCAAQNVDDILIGNYPASDEELAALTRIRDDRIQLHIQEEKEISDVEKQVLYEFKAHMDRYDHSSMMIRSSWSKGVYGKFSIPYRPCEKRMFERGDVLIVNDQLAHYRGELEIVLTSIPNDGERNLVGRIEEVEEGLLSFIQPGRLFEFLPR